MKKFIAFFIACVLIFSSFYYLLWRTTPEDKLGEELVSVMASHPNREVRIIAEVTHNPVFVQGMDLTWTSDEYIAGTIKAKNLETLAENEWIEAVYKDITLTIPEIPKEGGSGPTEKIWTLSQEEQEEEDPIESAPAPDLITTLKEARELINDASPLSLSKVKVAVIDTGIDNDHPAFDGITIIDHNIAGTRDDNVGHGTHCASIIAGTGKSYGELAESNEELQGVAYDIDITLCDVKAFSGSSASLSDITRAVKWCINNDVDVISMSFGAGADPWWREVAPLRNELNEAMDEGIICVAASGNAYTLITFPGNMKRILSVGALRKDEAVASFSSYKLGGKGDWPPRTVDVLAPGVDVVAALAEDSSFARSNRKDKYFYHPNGEQYIALSGTSMACPMVAGAATILKAAHPDWTHDDVKQALMENARHLPSVYDRFQGAGVVNIEGALYGTDTGGTDFTLSEKPVQLIFYAITGLTIIGLLYTGIRRRIA